MDDWTYTVIMIAASTIGGVWIAVRQRAWGIDGETRWGIGVIALFCAAVAAKLPFWLGLSPVPWCYVPNQFDGGPSSWVRSLGWMGGGKTILWGLAGGYAGVEFAKWLMGVQRRTGDAFVVPVAVSVAIGRLGCLAAGCCNGRPCTLPWAIIDLDVSHGVVARHPAQIYEMVFHGLFAALAWWCIRRTDTSPIGTRWSGHRSLSAMKGLWMPTYMVAYALFRFISETWRTEPEWMFGLTFYQVSSVGIGLIFATIIVMRRRHDEPPLTSADEH